MDSDASRLPALTKELLLVELKNGVNWRELERIYSFTDEDVQEWVATDDEFARTYRQIRKHNHANSRNGSLEIRVPNWQAAFLDAFKGLGQRATIAGAVRELNAAGIELSASTVYSRLNPKSAKYSPDFEDALVEAEAERVAPIEDTLIAQMQEGEVPSIAYKYLQGHPLTQTRFSQAPLNINVNKRSVELKVLEVRSQFRDRFIEQSHNRFGRSQPKEIVDAEGEVYRLDAAGEGANRERERGGEEGSEEAHEQEEAGQQEEVVA
jgi:hypothetical protein